MPQKLKFVKKIWARWAQLGEPPLFSERVMSDEVYRIYPATIHEGARQSMANRYRCWQSHWSLERVVGEEVSTVIETRYCLVPRRAITP